MRIELLLSSLMVMAFLLFCVSGNVKNVKCKTARYQNLSPRLRISTNLALQVMIHQTHTYSRKALKVCHLHLQHR